MLDTSAKICTAPEASARVAEAKRAGRRVVFANGCFDILHVGHIRYLQDARERGGFLVVGINSDESVRRLKGEGRPLLDENARARLVAALGCVDCVVVFGEPDVSRLLRELRPDIHAKGTDYTTETVPERTVMQELGGEVAIAGDAKDHSTRDLIRHILARCGSEAKERR